MHRVFRAALEDERIKDNPVAAARVPKMRDVRKERTMLTDAELASSSRATPQVLAIPGTLAPSLPAWCERAGKRESGPEP